MFAEESERKIKSALDQLLQKQGRKSRTGRRTGGDQFQNEILKNCQQKLKSLRRERETLRNEFLGYFKSVSQTFLSLVLHSATVYTLMAYIWRQPLAVGRSLKLRCTLTPSRK